MSFVKSFQLAALTALVSAAQLTSLQAQTSNSTDKVGVVSHIKVLSDKVEDVSSIEAWKKSFIKEGMTDEQKAKAIWETVVKFQHQDDPPVEYCQNENMVLDPIKMFNVYGYSFCSVASANMAALARYTGLKARNWTINAHVVPEIYWDDSWHMLDASLINYFPKPDGKIASVEEIVATVKDWYAKNPDYKGNNAKLNELMRQNGWSGWKTGPDLLTQSPLYDASGWLPAGTHGWYSTMQEYDGSTLFEYESGYSMGYQVNVQLRPGERLTRNWFNKGLHVKKDEGSTPGALTAKVGQDAFRYTPKYGDLAPGRIGNGTLEYDVPLADGTFRSCALKADNLAARSEDKQNPAVHVKDAAQSGVLEIRMSSSYVYLGGELTFKSVVGQGGQVSVFLSENNGLDWKDVTTVTASGDQNINLKPFVMRRYDYRLRFVFKGKGTGLDALKINHDIQHSQRPLPALKQGNNTITFSAAKPEGTITIEGSSSLENKGKQLVYTDFHPDLKGIQKNSLRPEGGEGEVMFPIQTPGDMTRLRLGTFYRARDARDVWDIQVSFDDGRTFKSVEKLEGPTKFFGKYTVVADVPPNTRKALVRYAGTQRNTAAIFNYRIDADYKEPQGGFRPVKVTYLWEEGGLEKRDVHIATKPEEQYQIRCESIPRMKSLIVELAQ